MSAEENLIENATTISDKLVQYMDSAERVIQQYGGDAAELGLNVLRIEAGYNLILALSGAILALFIIKFCWTSTKRFGFDEDFPNHPVIMLKFIGTFAGVMVGVINGAALLNIWYWVGLFWPEAYAVHKFLM